MSKFLNEKPFGHRCRYGTAFKAKRCDFVGGVTAQVPATLTIEQAMADGIEMGGWHAANIWGELNGFAGYDCVRVAIEPRPAEIEGAEEDGPVPEDYADPTWEEGGHVHNWHNHVPEFARAIWHTFTDKQQQVLALWAERIASMEEWE